MIRPEDYQSNFEYWEAQAAEEERQKARQLADGLRGVRRTHNQVADLVDGLEDLLVQLRQAKAPAEVIRAANRVILAAGASPTVTGFITTT